MLDSSTSQSFEREDNGYFPLSLISVRKGMNFTESLAVIGLIIKVSQILGEQTHLKDHFRLFFDNASNLSLCLFGFESDPLVELF